MSLKRSDRFDKEILIDNPKKEARACILRKLQEDGSCDIKGKEQKRHAKKPKEQKQKPPNEFKPFGKGGVRIGDEEPDDKWRCEVCTFQNDMSAELCVMCGSPKSGKWPCLALNIDEQIVFLFGPSTAKRY